jgi:nicotinate-nucleotide pyrophosphorylase (carboxylating)
VDAIMDFAHSSGVSQLVQIALQEDVGRGDFTTEWIVDPRQMAVANVYVRQSGRVAGLPVMDEVFHSIDPQVGVLHLVEDGTDVVGETAVARLSGRAGSILTAERTALNFLGRLSGIATTTREAVKALDGYRAKLLDTRKTTPGWRLLEKYAVRVGGAVNHRFGLDDMVLIKDNHVVLAGGIREAIRRVRERQSLSMKVEVEVESLTQLDEALAEGVDMVLLDNMDLDVMREAVRIVNKRVRLEASGGITVERLAEVAATGVDYISMGALTHSAVSLDVGLNITFTESGQ